jgi:PRC-barrel domain
MNHSTHTPLAAFELNAANLVDAVVYGPDDEKVGTVSHVHSMPSGTRVIVDVGGFLGLGSKPVALDATSLHFMRDDNGTVHATTSSTKDQIKALPEHIE